MLGKFINCGWRVGEKSLKTGKCSNGKSERSKLVGEKSLKKGKYSNGSR